MEGKPLEPGSGKGFNTVSIPFSPEGKASMSLPIAPPSTAATPGGAPMTALVTGGSGEIGAAICRRLLEEGAEVVSLARTAPTWRHPRLTAVTANLMDPEATSRVAAELAARHRFTHIVHNAAALRPDSLEETRLQDLEALLRLHLAAPLLLAQAALPAMRAAQFGRIVLVASQAALGRPGHGACAASVAGLLGMMRSWALELAPLGITVNAVAPGAIAGSQRAEAGAALAARVPMRRLGTPDEVARAVMFFASARAGFITGQTLSVCGGASISPQPS